MTNITHEQIVRSRRRTLAIVITHDARVEVRSPLNMPVEFIEKFIERKSAWIDRKIAEVASRPRRAMKEFVEGETFPYLGVSYPLMIRDSASEAFSFDNGFYLAVSAHNGAKQLFIDWYRSQAALMIKDRLDARALSNKISYDKFRITGARSKWGSCSGRGRLCFSWRLVMAPLNVIDYVVAHELAHIDRKDHSKQFWARVAELFPEYRESESWLKDNGHFLAGII